MTDPARALIEQLELQPHPEGGWFRETYRASLTLPGAALPDQYGGDRPAATAILYLLAAGEVSRLHRLRGEELWLYRAGPGLVLHVLEAGGGHRTHRLGAGPEAAFQAVVPGGRWFGAEPADPAGWGLVICVMAPGFDPADCAFADRDALLRAHPDHADLIRRLTP